MMFSHLGKWTENKAVIEKKIKKKDVEKENKKEN